jgi:hypothetical protein
MAQKKKKIEYKPKKHPRWEDAVTAAINGTKANVSFYPKDGELYLPLGDEVMYSLIIKKDGTWDLG